MPNPIDPMVEVLLTAWALSQLKGKLPPLNRVFPERLQSTLRRARRLEYVEVDKEGVYLLDAGCAYLAEHGDPRI